MKRLLSILLTALLAFSCSSPDYDVVVVGGGPAGIGAALAAAKTGARTALIERNSRVGGTTVQAEVCDMGLFYAWRKQIIAGPAWEMVCEAVAQAAFRRCDPREVPLEEIKTSLSGIGHLVPKE